MREQKDVLKAIDEVMLYGHSGMSGRITGWCSRDKAHALATAVVEFRPEVTVELGVWGGASLVPLAIAHDVLEHGHVYGVDPWTADAAIRGVQEVENLEWWGARDYEAIYRDCLQAVLDLRLTSRCTVIRATSERAHSLFDEIDLLHVDGNHSEAASTLDVFLYLPKVRSGGHVFFDDVDWHSTENAVRLVEERCEKVTEIRSEPGGVCAVYRMR